MKKETKQLDRYQDVQIKCPNCGKVVSPVMQYDGEFVGDETSIPLIATGERVDICWNSGEIDMGLDAHCPSCGRYIGTCDTVEKLWKKTKKKLTSEERSWIREEDMLAKLTKAGISNDTMQFIMMQLYGSLLTNEDIDKKKEAVNK